MNDARHRFNMLRDIFESFCRNGTTSATAQYTIHIFISVRQLNSEII